MGGLLKSLGMLLPPLRRLHEERNLYAQDVAILRARLLTTEAASKCIENENVTLQSANAKLLVEVERLSKLTPVVAPRRLHVVGYARSGTTILMDILNSSNDVFLFSELNLHLLRKFPELFSAYGGHGFVEHFTERKRKELPLCYKGAIPPSTDLDFVTPDQYVDAVGQSFRYVGDKIATAHRSMGGVPDLELLKDFLEQEDKSGAVLIFTLRRPSENLLSVSKMFPEADLKLWGKSLAEASVAIVESFLRGNQSYLVFHEDISLSLIAELSELLGVKLRLSPELVGAPHQKTKGVQFSMNDPWVAELDAAYSELYKIYSCDNGAVKHSKTDGLVKKIALIVKQLKTLITLLSIEEHSRADNIKL